MAIAKVAEIPQSHIVESARELAGHHSGGGYMKGTVFGLKYTSWSTTVSHDGAIRVLDLPVLYRGYFRRSGEIVIAHTLVADPDANLFPDDRRLAEEWKVQTVKIPSALGQAVASEWSLHIDVHELPVSNVFENHTYDSQYYGSVGRDMSHLTWHEATPEQVQDVGDFVASLTARRY
jgi:hypothetical protein